MAAKKRVKKQTLAEFHAWLQGVEEIQPNDWAPNSEQWKMIRERIMNIKESDKEVVVVNQQAPSPQQVHRAPGATPPPSEFVPAPPMIPSSFDKHGVGPGMVAPGGAPPNAGIPPGSPIARPNPAGLPTSPPPQDGPDSPFE